MDPLEDSKPDVTLVPLSVDHESTTGVHFLTDEESSKSEDNYEKKKWDFLEYMPQSDGRSIHKSPNTKISNCNIFR